MRVWGFRGFRVSGFRVEEACKKVTHYFTMIFTGSEEFGYVLLWCMKALS